MICLINAQNCKAVSVDVDTKSYPMSNLATELSIHFVKPYGFHFIAFTLETTGNHAKPTNSQTWFLSQWLCINSKSMKFMETAIKCTTKSTPTLEQEDMLQRPRAWSPANLNKMVLSEKTWAINICHVFHFPATLYSFYAFYLELQAFESKLFQVLFQL